MKGQRRIQCSFELLYMLVCGDGHRAKSDIPSDVEIVDVLRCDEDRLTPNVFSIIVESEQWEPIEEGAKIPFLYVMFESLPRIRTPQGWAA